MKTPNLSRAAGLSLLLIAVAACGDATGSRNRVPLSLSFSTKGLSRAKFVAAGIFQPAADLTVGASGELVIKKVQVVLRSVQLSANAEGNCDGEGELECEDVAQAPVIADVPVTTGIKTALTVPVTPGTYSRLDAEIGPPENDQPGYAAFIAANPSFKGKSLRVEGTYKGVAFVYFASIDASLQMKLVPPLVVAAAGTNNITVDVDIASWFKTSAGAALDPSNSANAQAILKNIKASFKAFGDDDEDGQNDAGDDDKEGNNQSGGND